jgi:hypothetical protein
VQERERERGGGGGEEQGKHEQANYLFISEAYGHKTAAVSHRGKALNFPKDQRSE